MGTTSEELKKLYKKLGGKDPKVAGFSAPGEILNAINEIPLPTEYELPTVTTEDAGDVLVVNEEGKWDKGEAGGGLPEVTTDDNGKILQVVEGLWEKAAMSTAVVYYSIIISGNNYKITDEGVTTRTIINDFNNGKFVVLRGSTQVFVPARVEDTTVYFVHSTSTTNAEVVSSRIICLKTNGIDKNTLSTTICGTYNMPGPDYYHIGKVLAVNRAGTSYELIDLPASLPEVTTDDNGDILQVVNGAWTKAEPSGGDVVIFTASIQTFTDNTLTLTLSNKTMGDIKTALEGGKQVMINANNRFFVTSNYNLMGYVFMNSISIDPITLNTTFNAIRGDLSTATENRLYGKWIEFTPS